MLRSSIAGFDKIMQNEEPIGSIILVEGTPGSLKSTLMFTAMSNYTRTTSTKGLYIAMEESKDAHLMNLKNMSFELSPSVEIIDYDYTKLDFEWILKAISDYRQEQGEQFTCLVMDSLNALYSMIDTVKNRGEFYSFFKKLKEAQITTFLIAEKPKDKIYENMLIGSEEFLCDGVIELGYVEIEGKVKRYIQVWKMRGVKHKMDKFFISVRPGEGMGVVGELLI